MSEKVFNQVVIDENWQTPGLTILILSWEYPPNVVGGLSRHVSGLAIHLARIGFNVHVITAGNGDLPQYEKIYNVNVHRVKPLNEQDSHFFSWIGGLNLAMVQKATELKFDLIHVHDWLVGVAGIVLKETFVCPLLTTIHATEHGRNNGIHNEIQRFIHQKEQQLMGESDQIIVCSKYMKSELISVFKVREEKIVIIPNGIEEKKAIIKSEKVFSDWEDKKIIFSIGRIVEEKGFKTIINTASLVKEKGLNIFFVIAGKGPMLERYRNEVNRRKLSDHLAFIGYISDEEKNSYILQSDITVFPSLYEPFGIVALESMILGKPTIVSNVGGLKSIIGHMDSGLLMAPGDAKSLLEQIIFLLDNPEKAKDIGFQGKKVVRALYGWKRVASETKRTIEDMLINNRINNQEIIEQIKGEYLKGGVMNDGIN
ncbi:glycosyltransferase family 4 protein [Neobacillus sp. PS3-40]|uniref:glycosyltransferase family 4 protein n=1 Tax=Neobacillus sp. PS3-40 TaxID=3070679 RepID=UPI0027DFCE71|nr:glycosyltransferase family 4 protein [Neobacillus sp. PS3-40]WML45314.1 glycosyltransferase family 4 protein [Neobacillus sp. PS3-40]